MLKDSLSLIRQLETQSFSQKQTILLTLADVAALYPSISIEHGMTVDLLATVDLWASVDLWSAIYLLTTVDHLASVNLCTAVDLWSAVLASRQALGTHYLNLAAWFD